MKTTLLPLLLLLNICLVPVAAAQVNLVVNGDFEQQNSPPRGRRNIVDTNGSGADYDDLFGWAAVVSLQSSGARSYYATNAFVIDQNPQSSTGFNPASGSIIGPFAPHSGQGCVSIGREPGVYDSDGMVAQQLGQPLIAGHLYHAEFWVLKRPSGKFKTKFALSITAGGSAPVFDGRPTINSLLPTPLAVVSSDFITSSSQWTLVSGFFTASQSGSAWATVGFDRPEEVFDSSLPDFVGNGPFITYVIDDVALYDLGCNTSLSGPPLSVIGPHGQVQEWDLFCAPVQLDCSINPPAGSTNFVWSINSGSLAPGDYVVNTLPTDPASVYRVSIRKPTYYYQAYPLFDIVCNYVSPSGCPTTSRLNNIQTRGSLGGNSACSSGEPPVERSAAYPNPADTQVQLPPGATAAELYDNYARRVAATATGAATATLQVQALPAGLYQLRYQRAGRTVAERLHLRH